LTVSLLIVYGADVNQRDRIGNTALHLAACTGHIDVVTVLLQAGTDVNAEDMAGHTPLQLARSRLRLLTEDSFLRATPFRLQHEIAQVLFIVSLLF
jgi:ankyrin repeat protein